MWWDVSAVLFCTLLSLVLARVARSPLRLDRADSTPLTASEPDRESASRQV